MLVVCAITLLCLMSVSHAAPLACVKLIEPLDELVPHHLEGKWSLVAGSLSRRPSVEPLALRDSITMIFSNSSEASTISYNQINRFGDQCQYLHYNVSVQRSSFTFDVGNGFELTGFFLYTSCQDCVVMQWNVKSRMGVSKDLYLLSRRRKVEQEEMDEFRAQVICSLLPVPDVMDPTKEVCPEQPERQPTAAAATAAAHNKETTVQQEA